MANKPKKQRKMGEPFFYGLLGGSITRPDVIMNQGPLPSNPPGPGQFSGIPDGEINTRTSLLGDVGPYSYGKPARMATQTQLAHPHAVQMAIPRLCIPAPQAEPGAQYDPILEHALCDGDLAFTLRMPTEMVLATSQYCIVPNAMGGMYAPLVNLATVNYILWGLQVGAQQPMGSRWKKFFNHMCKTDHLALNGNYSEADVFHFLESYIAPFGIMRGSEMQGGQHEGSSSAVTYPVDFVSSFAIEGKILKVNNLWRQHDVVPGDHLVLELVLTEPNFQSTTCVLTSGTQATRNERIAQNNSRPFYILQPKVMLLKTIIPRPHIYIGMSNTYSSAYHNHFGRGAVEWDARASLIGIPLEVFLAHRFVPSHAMWLLEAAEEEQPLPQPQQPQPQEPPKPAKKPKLTASLLQPSTVQAPA